MSLSPRLAPLLLAAVLAASAVAVQAATVRGRLDRVTRHGIYPAAFVRVTLNSRHLGRSSPAYTNARGFYYFYNIPPGGFLLEVWIGRKRFVKRIRVYPPHTDIPPLRLRY
jgi:hypothetical protein